MTGSPPTFLRFILTRRCVPQCNEAVDHSDLDDFRSELSLDKLYVDVELC